MHGFFGEKLLVQTDGWVVEVWSSSEVNTVDGSEILRENQLSER